MTVSFKDLQDLSPGDRVCRRHWNKWRTVEEVNQLSHARRFRVQCVGLAFVVAVGDDLQIYKQEADDD